MSRKTYQEKTVGKSEMQKRGRGCGKKRCVLCPHHGYAVFDCCSEKHFVLIPEKHKTKKEKESKLLFHNRIQALPLSRPSAQLSEKKVKKLDLL